MLEVIGGVVIRIDPLSVRTGGQAAPVLAHADGGDIGLEGRVVGVGAVVISCGRVVGRKSAVQKTPLEGQRLRIGFFGRPSPPFHIQVGIGALGCGARARAVIVKDHVMLDHP